MEHDEIRQVSKEREELLAILSQDEKDIGAEDLTAAADGPEDMVEVMPKEISAVIPERENGGEIHPDTVPPVQSRRRDKITPQRRSRRLREEPQGSRAYIRPSDGLMAAFLVPVVVMLIIFAQRGIFPFGEESFLRTDMYHQYAPFFSEFQHKLTEGGSLLYSWDIGMGVNFAALYAYYLASPLNWLLVLCPKDFIIEFMTYSIVLKIGLSGLTFAYYLRKHCRTSDFGVAFFGIFYALSGYMAAYSWNIMWLDCILLFPLIMLGLERLVKEKKSFLYCITLGLSILSNYYISIMICIFMVFYFIALLIMESKKSWKDYAYGILQFSVYSLVAGGLAAIVLLPEVYALQATASGDFNFPKTVTSYFSIFDMFARHIGNVEIEIGLDHWPNIYCGVAVLLFFLLYLVCRKISVKEKVVYCGLLLFFFASFSVNVLNFIWHGFHYPNSLPCRQSFIYIFLMLVVCYRAYMNLKAIPWKHIVLAFLGAVCFVLLAEKVVEQEHFQFYMFYVAIVFLGVYAGLLYLYKTGRMNINGLLVLTLAVVTVEAAVNTTVTSVTTTGRTAYIADNHDVKKLINPIETTDAFYRIEKVDRKTKNDGAWMNFPSVSLFSSTANADLTAFFKQIGCEGNTNAYSITGSTPLVDSLFSVKYGLYSEEQDNELLTLKGQEGDTWLYERNYTLPLGFVVDPDMEVNWQRDLGNPAKVQNDLCDLVGAAQVLTDAGGEAIIDTFWFTPEESGDYYVYVSNRKIEEVTVSKGGESETFKNVNRGFLLEIGYCEAGEEVTVKAEEEDQEMAANAYLFHNLGLESVYNILSRYPLAVTSWTDDSIEGVVTAQKAGTLFTSIPYDKGWTVKIDGTEYRSNKMFDTFLAVDIPQGTHTVTMEYEPEGLRQGAIITGGCILFLIVMWGIHKLVAKRREERFFDKPDDIEDNEDLEV